MGALATFLVGAIGAAFGLFFVAFVVTPIRKFFDLRGEVIRRLLEFANVRARFKEIPDDVGATSGEMEVFKLPPNEIMRLEETQRVLRDLASQMRASVQPEAS